MPAALTYPGVYIEELPGAHTITGVATSITAFVGAAAQGPLSTPITIHSFADFERRFGGLSVDKAMGYAVSQYFANGGSTAIIVRVAKNDAKAAEIDLPAGGGQLQLQAASPGAWGNSLGAIVEHPKPKVPVDPADAKRFNLTVGTFGADGTFNVGEVLLNLSVDSADPRFVTGTLVAESQLVVLKQGSAVPADPPDRTPKDTGQPLAAVKATADSGGDGSLDDAAIEGDENAKTGIYALANADLFNLLVLTPAARDADVSAALYQAALAYCQKRRAVLLVDAGHDWNHDNAEEKLDALGLHGIPASYGAVYFPRLKAPDPLRGGQIAEFPPSGAVAGVIASTDAQRGVWKAPAGVDAAVQGIQEFTVPMTDPENGDLNPLGINCLRSFPVYGQVVWGARTLRGADQLADQWKYLPVRRTALYIEESLYRGTKWVVFEPNDEPLWASIRLAIGAFMHDLFRQGAFQGSTPRDAYFVKCDHDTTTQNDIDLGRVNIAVGFAPLKPAEFVVITIQQMAGQVEV